MKWIGKVYMWVSVSELGGLSMWEVVSGCG